MSKVLVSILIATLLAAPAGAVNWQDQSASVRPGAFLGAQLKLPLGHHATKPRAELAFAPTQSRISNAGMVRTRIGEGIALSFSPRAKPTLNLAGVRADSAVGLARRGQSKTSQKLGVSTAGWVAIGVGTALVVGAAAWYIYWQEATENED